MIRVFEKSSPDFQRRLDALCNRSSELAHGHRSGGAQDDRQGARRGRRRRAGADRGVRQARSSTRWSCPRPSGTRWRRRSRPTVRAALEHAAAPRARVPRARAPRLVRDLRGRRARRQPRRSAGPRRHLRPGRQGPLPVDGDHDRGPGARRRRARDHDDHARAVARDAGGRAAGRRRPRVRDRRRAGDRGDGLRHRERAARRQDRRPGQRLRRGRQAAGVRRRRHRFDRRPDRGRHRRRRQRRPALDRRRSAGPGRTRRAGGPDPDRARQGPRATPSPPRSTRQLAELPRARDRRPARWPTRARSSSSTATPRSCGWSTGWRPNTRSWRCATRARWRRSITTAGAVFIGAHTPESVGDYIAGPSHVLPTGGSARFASPLGVGPTSSSARRSSNTTPPRWRAQADDIERLADVEDLHGHGRAVTIRARGWRRHEPGGDAARNDLPVPRSEGGARQGQRGEVGRPAGRRWPPTACRSGSPPSACWPR